MIQDIEFAFHFHGKAINGVFNFGGRISVEVTEAATQVRRTAHLPHEPRHALGALGNVGGQKGFEFFGQIEQDRTRFKHALWFGRAVVQQRWNFRIWIHAHKAAAKLHAFADANEPSIVFSACVPKCQQLFQHDGHFDAIGGAQ